MCEQGKCGHSFLCPGMCGFICPGAEAGGHPNRAGLNQSFSALPQHVNQTQAALYYFMPTYPDGMAGWWCREALKRVGEAVEDYREALEVQPNNPEAQAGVERLQAVEHDAISDSVDTTICPR